ncbi:RIIa domain-containing protein 1-like [Ptychodera flava]|uniref:RIIa domain-containing protein 1-like n=1 Tax=Ptychodera flava TaxID=63121 RepID=UPI00396A46F2
MSTTSKMAMPNHDPPHGMEAYDIGALSQEQQEKLNQFKIQTRMANERYLRQHPEVDLLLAGFLGDILMKRPENVREFAAQYFTDGQLPEKIEGQVQHREAQLRNARLNRKI